MLYVNFALTLIFPPQKWTWWSGQLPLFHPCVKLKFHRVIREATAKSKDGRIDQVDFLNHVASTTRYGVFSPMEASIIFHFAGRGSGTQRLALIDFAQLLDPRWQAPADSVSRPAVADAASFLEGFAHSAYNFALGGLAGSLGATMVYPIDLGEQQAVHLG